VRHDDQAVDLLVAVVGEREHRPVLSGLAPAHLDAAHDAVGGGGGRDLDAIAFGFEPLDRVGEVDGRGVDAHIDRLDGARDIRAGRDAEQSRHRDHGAQKTQNLNLPAPRPPSAKAPVMSTGALAQEQGFQGLIKDYGKRPAPLFTGKYAQLMTLIRLRGPAAAGPGCAPAWRG
jgi:hypothetical protein